MIGMMERPLTAQSSAALSRKIGVDLGWDMFVHGIHVPHDADQAVRSGYIEASTRAHKKEADRYTRKWIRMRYNAHLRSRVVDEEVTPDYLAFIDVRICPISKVELTHGTGEDTDWSIDRLNNNGGYCQGNLAVMSTRVNKAKGSKSLDDIIELAYGDKEDTGELNKFEWGRLAALMYGACIAEKAYPVIPMVLRPGRDTLIGSWGMFMQYMLVTRSGQKILKRLVTGQRNKALVKLCKNIERRIHKMPFGSASPDVWFNKALFLQFMAFYDSIQDICDLLCEDKEIMKRFGEEEGITDSWCLDTKGYLK